MKTVLFSLALAFVTNTTTVDIPEAPDSQLTAETENVQSKRELRTEAVHNVIESYYPSSPLVDHADDFVATADKYDVDWRLLPSISGAESTFGKQCVPGTYNAYGWGQGYIYFDSWEDGIETVIGSLRKNYIDKGAETVYEIGPIYAEATHWSSRVTYFMNKFDEEYLRLQGEVNNHSPTLSLNNQE